MTLSTIPSPASPIATSWYEQEGWRNRYPLQHYDVLELPEGGTWWLEVWFEPILPNGSITCSSCG